MPVVPPAPLRITLDDKEYPCSSWKKVEQGKPVSIAWNDGYPDGTGQPRIGAPTKYYNANQVDTSSPPYIRLMPVAQAVSGFPANIDQTLPIYVIGARQPDATDVVYVLNGLRRYKINRSTMALIETVTKAGGTQYGRPQLFESFWRLALGESFNSVRLTVNNGAGTDVETSMGVVSRHFGIIQKEGVSQLARSTNNSIALSPDGTTWGSTTEVGESSMAIADMLTFGGELLVIKPDGPYKFDSLGNSRPMQQFVGAHPSVSDDIGANSHGHGTYAFWCHSSGLWRIVGDLMTQSSFDAIPGFYSFESTDFDLSSFWSSVVAYGRWLYATRGTQAFSAYINDDGTLTWHGSFFDAGSNVRIGMDINPVTNAPSLWIFWSAFILRFDLQADGSMRAPLGSNRLLGTGTFRDSRWDGSRMDRTKQLRRYWVITEGLGAGDSVQPKVRRDGAAAENVGAAITGNGLFEQMWTPGTLDTCKEVEAQFTLTNSTSGDPRIRAHGIDAHTFDLYEAKIPLLPDTVRGYSGGIRGMLSRLRHLQQGDILDVKEPEVNYEFQGYVLGVTEEVVPSEGGEGIGYMVTVHVERGTIPA